MILRGARVNPGETNSARRCGRLGRRCWMRWLSCSPREPAMRKPATFKIKKCLTPRAARGNRESNTAFATREPISPNNSRTFGPHVKGWIESPNQPINPARVSVVVRSGLPTWRRNRFWQPRLQRELRTAFPRIGQTAGQRQRGDSVDLVARSRDHEHQAQAVLRGSEATTVLPHKRVPPGRMPPRPSHRAEPHHSS
jgi:hypothetical protein